MPSPATVMNGLLASEYFDLPLICAGDTFRIFVARPAFADAGPCSVILVAGGNAAFPLVMSIQRALSMGADYPHIEDSEYARAILGSNIEPGGPRLAFLGETTGCNTYALRGGHGRADFHRCLTRSLPSSPAA